MPKIIIKPITPKLRFDGIGKIIVKEQRREARNVQREYEQVTRTWENQPDFEITEKDKNIYVETDDKVFGFVDKGTKPHIIKPKRPGYPLRFNTVGFRSKSVPKKLTARAGSPAKPPEARPMVVHHPGFPARRFTMLIRERSIKRFKKNLDKALAVYLRGK